MTAAARPWSWLFRRLVLWGLATGAGAGATVGALLGADAYRSAGGALTGAMTGAVLGVIVALIPSLLGATVVTDAVRTRDNESRVLAVCFAIVAGVINVGSVTASLTYGDAYGLLILLAGNAGGLPMLWWGHRRITRAMS
ncbi:MAG TPA: hypothetical protein VNT52_13030 [Acidimicrobiales bacterium]|nr:hypothetical protein [Acidimicrobiales bacterium]